MAFTPNYTYIPFSQETYNNKSQYDSNIFIVYPNKNFSIRKGSTKPVFICYVKQRGEQFGDALGFQIGGGQSIIFRCFNPAGGIIINATMTSTDANLGEWIYNFSNLDFESIGHYEGEIIISTISTENVIGKFKFNVT